MSAFRVCVDWLASTILLVVGLAADDHAEQAGRQCVAHIAAAMNTVQSVQRYGTERSDDSELLAWFDRQACSDRGPQRSLLLNN